MFFRKRKQRSENTICPKYIHVMRRSCGGFNSKHFHFFFETTTILRSVDLFSGCGGLAYGLRHFCHTVLYAEIREACQLALQSNMKRGYLHEAPIISDVRDVPMMENVDIVCAGFPCKDVTSIGSGRGLRGKHSSLLIDTVAVIQKLQPTYIF